MLFQQRETAIQREMDLENKIRDLELQQRVALYTDNHAAHKPLSKSRGPSIASNMFSNHPQTIVNTRAMKQLETYSSDSSDGNSTTTDEEDESLTLRELDRCASQIQRLLYCIEDVKDEIRRGRTVKHYRKRLYKSYERSCRRFEQSLVDSYRRYPAVDQTGLAASAVVQSSNELIDTSIQESAVHEVTKVIQTPRYPHYSGEISSVGRASAVGPAENVHVAEGFTPPTHDDTAIVASTAGQSRIRNWLNRMRTRKRVTEYNYYGTGPENERAYKYPMVPGEQFRNSSFYQTSDQFTELRLQRVASSASSTRSSNGNNCVGSPALSAARTHPGANTNEDAIKSRPQHIAPRIVFSSLAADEEVLDQSIDNVTDVTATKRDNEQVESPLSKEWINPIEDARLNTTEVAGRDIVDILLEQWTVPIGV